MRVFLSHSSSDKPTYVKYIADKLGDRAFYDEYSFENCSITVDEILRNMDSTDIFVLFISQKALDSAWVKTEIENAKNLLAGNNIKRFLPILIDPSMDHTDARIPNWITENYNVRLVAKPSIALRRINNAYSQLSLAKHPKFSERNKLFVGRNELLSAFESRIDDYTLPVPTAIIVSGLRDVGRKSLIIEGLRKTNKIRDYYQPLKISLQPEDGIEGFISKVHDLGLYSGGRMIDELASMSMESKIDFLVELLTDVAKQNEIILVDDWRSIVRFRGEVADWFLPVCVRCPENKIVLAISSATMPSGLPNSSYRSIFRLRLSELDGNERMNLLARYLRDVEGISDFQVENFGKFSDLLNGYPEQVIYAGQLIANKGIDYALDNGNLIKEFSDVRASVYAERYRDDPDLYEFLTFLSWFEFISTDMIKSISAIIGKDLISFLNQFIEDMICELIGAVGEYVRLNDVIRDYVSRGSLEIPSKYSAAVKTISKDMFRDDDFQDYDYSEKYAAVRLSLLEGRDVPERLLIPAHFLGAISHKYKTRKYNDVVTLADRILQRGRLEEYIKSQVLHYLCMALARTRSQRFLSEVQKIKGEEHNYVLGFYYRLVGRYDDALERLERAISNGRWEENAKREIVLIYNIKEDYIRAEKLARESFEKNPANPIAIQAYYQVLSNLRQTGDIEVKMQALIGAISKINSDRAAEICECMRAEYAFNVKNDFSRAIQIVQGAVSRFSNGIHPLLTNLDFVVRLKDVPEIEKCLELIRQNHSNLYKNNVHVKKATILLTAMSDDKAGALARVDSELAFLHEQARERLKSRIMAA